MSITCKAIYENGVFRPVEPLGAIPEHSCVQMVVDIPAVDETPGTRRVLGLSSGMLEYMADDFDAPLGDDFWLGDADGKDDGDEAPA